MEKDCVLPSASRKNQWIICRVSYIFTAEVSVSEMRLISMKMLHNMQKKQTVWSYLSITGLQIGIRFLFLFWTVILLSNMSGSTVSLGILTGNGSPWAVTVLAACAIRSRECGKTDICFQMLVYPVMDARMRTESMKKYTDSPIWNARLTKRMWEIYLRNGDMGKRCYASPLEAGDFRKLPPAYVEVEQYDCLHDEGVEYFRELRKAGVPARLREVKGTFHGFDVFRNTRATEKMLKIRSRALYEAFWKQEP